jgi:hypothetical protein
VKIALKKLYLALKNKGEDWHPTHVGSASNPLRRCPETSLRKIAAVTFSFLVLSAAGWAQFPTGGNVFFGYSFSQGQAFTGLNSGSANMNGWEGSAEAKFLPWIGVAADFDWHYGGHDLIGCTGFSCTPKKFRLNASRHTILFGPRASISFGRYTPFAEFLLGIAHQTDTGGGISNSDTSFSTAIGGGLDYKLIKGVAWRLQGDEIHTRFFGGAQDYFRFSTGIVFRF